MPESRYPVPNACGALYEELTSSAQYVIDIAQPPPAEPNDGAIEQQRTINLAGATIELFRSVVEHGPNWRSFIVQKGHLGSGPLDIRHVDNVCVMFGLKMPVILR
jgi:hypothetical protein